ncbi:cytochrome P450, partial [Nocardioides sp.]|uniref:cytochrome P450 n=1 Tax=Nocardioides sp. TaxID=35761 RepID=UPI00286EAE6B
FPTNVSRGSDLSASTAETRTGHHIYTPLAPAQVDRGRWVFLSEWTDALAGAGFSSGAAEFEAMQLLRRPVARATCAAVLGDLDPATRNQVADQVLAWIDALAPVISSPRAPGRWSRARRGERRARLALDDTLTDVLAALGITETPPIVATMLAAGIQVPIAAGAWLLVFLADHRDHDVDPDHAVWEALRLTPPTWVTARVTTAPVELAGQHVPAGEVVLVSPLLLGRLAELVPGDPADLGTFDPTRWHRDDVRAGAWLPFGAGAHACPGRTLGFGLLRDLAVWAGRHRLALASSVTIDQSRGILPSPARITVSPRMKSIDDP